MSLDAPAGDIVRLNFRDTGPRDSRLTLLLVHAWGARLEFWDECAAVWEKQFRVVAVDLAGAGGSPLPARPRTRDENAADLVAVRQKLGLQGVVPIGCAMGSLIAAGYAAMDAGFVSGLVLCDTAPGLGEAARERTLARAAAVRAGGMQAVMPGAVDMAFEAQPRDARYRRYSEMFAANDPEGYASIALGMMGTDNSALLAALKCPTLIVAGGHDLLLPPDLSRQVHALMPGSEFSLIEAAAHFPPAQTPEVFSELVLGFLDRRVRHWTDITSDLMRFIERLLGVVDGERYKGDRLLRVRIAIDLCRCLELTDEEVNMLAIAHRFWFDEDKIETFNQMRDSLFLNKFDPPFSREESRNLLFLSCFAGPGGMEDENGELIVISAAGAGIPDETIKAVICSHIAELR